MQPDERPPDGPSARPTAAEQQSVGAPADPDFAQGTPADPINAPSPPADAGHAQGTPAAAGNAQTSAPPWSTAAGAPSVASALPQPQAWGDYVVEIRGVSHRFGEVVAINGISLGVPAGTILGIIGPSGSGKTTTIRVMTGALAPEHGAARVLGEDPRYFHRRTRERVGYMPQLFVLYPDLTARENVDFVAALFGLLGGTRRRRVDEVLELVELGEARDRRASQLSGGMQRRLTLACALVHEPTLLILDEPTAGIDPILRQRVWDELRRLREAGVTLLVTTQYVTEAEYCDSVALISSGQLVAFGAPEDLRRQALGGEVIEIVTTKPFDAAALRPLDGVVEVRQTGPREILVIAEEAGRAGPQVVDAVDDAGGDVEYSREYRPTFDEVFTALVTRHMAQQEAPAGAAPPPGPLTMGRPR
ncbi:MAG TPA: ATP-binding cassette domain-containing protein [Candidatus Limnocylindria bacterium]|nr:ATP-binding cassette domain-containing protein [Candidatus Limnocylindria bacterium]